MAIQYHFKGSRRRAVALRQQNASAIKRGLPALIITAERKEERRSK